VAITHQRFHDIEPIGLAIDTYDFATVTIGVEHIDEHLAVADEVDERGTCSAAVRLIFLGRVDVLQTHVDVASLGRAHQKTIAVEYLANRA
jgi:hypothetical protein